MRLTQRTGSAALFVKASMNCRHFKWQDQRMRFHMKYIAAVLIGFIVYFSSGVTLAATPQSETTAASAQVSENQGNMTRKETQNANTTKPGTSNRASMLYILLVAGVMIVAVNLVVSFARKKMEEDIKVAQEKSGTEPQKNKS